MKQNKVFHSLIFSLHLQSNSSLRINNIIDQTDKISHSFDVVFGIQKFLPDAPGNAGIFSFTVLNFLLNVTYIWVHVILGVQHVNCFDLGMIAETIQWSKKYM